MLHLRLRKPKTIALLKTFKLILYFNYSVLTTDNMIEAETEETPTPLPDIPQISQRSTKNMKDDAPQAVEMTTCLPLNS